jgi:glutamyl-tRNA reductase
MQLICLSLSHHNTPLKLRESFSLPDASIAAALEKQPVGSAEFEALREMIVLSTCNRLEVYALVAFTGASEETPEQAFDLLFAYLSLVYALPIGPVEPYFRRFSADAVVEHIFRVTTGLDSIAIGETQILGQVSRALDTALQLGSARHVLSGLFRAAIFTGRRVHTETEIGRHPVSLNSIAIHLAQVTSGPLDGRKILIIGAGKMGKATLEALLQESRCAASVTSPTYAHVLEVTTCCGGTPLPYARLEEGLADADVVFVSTASVELVLTAEMIAEALGKRPERSLTLIDCSVPRNVDPQARAIQGVRLFDMDDLQAYAQENFTRSNLEIARAMEIVAEETGGYLKLLRIVPFIGQLHRKIEDIRQREVEKTLKRLRDTSPEVNEQIEQLSRSLVRKILHEPTSHLRSESNQETLNEYVDALGKLFDLSEQPNDLQPETGET